MILLSTENISKSFGIKTLFRDLSFGIEDGQKTALVALNGVGKSTLLKMLTGQDTPDSGKIVMRNQLTIGYLEQSPQFDETASVLESIFQTDHPKLLIIKAYEAALEEPETASAAEHQKTLADAMEAMEHEKLWDYDYKIKEILSHLKITNLNQTVSTLSGGQRKRVALARVLVEEPDLLILDEPTNHLDLDMIEWLEEYLSRPNLTLFLVTHDRYLLDNVCNEILELDQGKLFRYTGNYSYFLEKKAEREEVSEREKGHLRNRLRHELEWIKRQPKARTTKSKSRVDAFYDLKEKASGKTEEQKLRLEVQMNRIGGKILELKKVHKSYGELNILNGFDYTFKKGERIGIVGSNGTGKSTLLNVITGLETPDSGKIDIGETIQFGYYSQKGLTVNEDKRVIDIVREYAEVISIGDGSTLTASQFLNLFQFPPAVQHTPVSKLSGGEKRRLYLLTVLIKNPNFLILDEPTNDLDLTTLNILEEFLMNFQGCLLVVSHDRYFMNRLVDHLFVFEGNGVIKDFSGNYSEYRESQKTDASKEAAVVKPKKDESTPKTKRSYKERQEFQELEKEIAELEIEKSELTEILSRGGSDYLKLQKHTLRLTDVIQLLDEKSTRWLELSEFK